MKGIVSNTQSSFDKLKRELSEKEKLIQDKNQEILRLRLQSEEKASQSQKSHQDRLALSSELASII